VRTHPDANGSRDRTTSYASAQVLREQHRCEFSAAPTIKDPRAGALRRPSMRGGESRSARDAN
jgi:hypothetical protein